MNALTLARGLGIFGIGLGVAQIAAPKKVGRLVGVRDRPKLMRAIGARELASGVALLTQRRPIESMWARAAGDVVDLALLGAAFREAATVERKAAAAIGAVLGVGLLDGFVAWTLTRASRGGGIAARA